MTQHSDPPPDAAVAEYALRLGDDALVLAQRLCQWITRAPDLEEDVALGNIALDLLGQARTLLSYAGTHDGRTEDDLAYRRTDREFRNCLIVELDNGDFATTIARQLLFSVYQVDLYAALCESTDPTIASLAAKAVKEVAYHADHATQWTLRLGDGTPESHRRMREGLEAVWPYADELFETDETVRTLVDRGVAADPAELLSGWQTTVVATIEQATLDVPVSDWHPSGGRVGRHSEGFGYLLAEMQSLARQHPEAQW